MGNNKTINVTSASQAFLKIQNSTFNNVVLNTKLHAEEVYGLSREISGSVFVNSEITIFSDIAVRFFGLSQSITNSTFTGSIFKLAAGDVSHLAALDVYGISESIRDSSFLNCSFFTLAVNHADYKFSSFAKTVSNSSFTGVAVTSTFDKVVSSPDIGCESAADSSFSQIIQIVQDGDIDQPYQLFGSCSNVTIEDWYHEVSPNYTFNSTKCTVASQNVNDDVRQFLKDAVIRDYFKSQSWYKGVDLVVHQSYDENLIQRTVGSVIYLLKNCSQDIKNGVGCIKDTCQVQYEGKCTSCTLLQEFQCSCLNHLDNTSACKKCENGYVSVKNHCLEQITNTHGFCVKLETGLITCMCTYPYMGQKCSVDGQIYGAVSSVTIIMIFVIAGIGFCFVNHNAKQDQRRVLAEIAENLGTDL